MVNARDEQPLTRLEIIVLARLSASKPPGPKDLAEAVQKHVPSTETIGRAREVALEILDTLRKRGLVNKSAKLRKGSLGDRSLTDNGQRMLRAVLGVTSTPTWSDIRSHYLPALALKLKPGSEQAKKTLKDKDTIAAAVLGAKLGVETARSVAVLCDSLIADALGMPRGELTLEKIRAHCLAKHIDIEPKGDLEEIAARAAAKELGARPANKDGFVPALGRRWACEVTAAPGTASSARLATPAGPIQHELPHALEPPAEPPPVARAPSTSQAQPSAPVPVAQRVPPTASDASAALLQAVQDAIPRVDGAGRFGEEKVFISALWHRVEEDRRLGELSLDRFKRWLVKANRERWLTLVRADLVGAMDAKLVADSEIEDRGATFHFVIDPQWGAAASERRTHVR